MNWLSNKLFYTIGITLLCGGLHAQSLAEAKKLYNEGKYAEAKPAFEKLVKQAPSNSSYNHWYGVCCYETGDLTGAENAFGGDMIRSLKNDNYLVMETEAQGFPGWTPYKGQLRQQAYSHLASGANSVMYWHWHSIHNTLWHHNFPCGLSKPKKEACLFFQTRFFFLYAFLYSLLLCILFTELPQMPHPDPR